MCQFTKYKEKNEFSDIDMQQRMELHIHEQYAVNNNANVSHTITLIAALLVIFASYGHIFLHIRTAIISDCCDLFCNPLVTDGEYSLLALVLVTFALLGVLYILCSLCIYQGAHQRYEQFIVHLLRYKYYKNPSTDLFDTVFSIKGRHGYHPFLYEKKSGADNSEEKKHTDNEGEAKKCRQIKSIKSAFSFLKNINIIQGVFGEFVKILMWVGFVIIVATCLRIICFFCVCPFSYVNAIIISVSILIALASVCAYSCFISKRLSKEELRYKELNEIYKAECKENKE